MIIKRFLLSITILSTLIFAQGHVVLPGESGAIVSFNYDKGVDFFGDEDFSKDNYNNSVDIAYVFDGPFGIDLFYGHSFFNANDESDITEGEFDFSNDFRSKNIDLSDKSFSFGFTYYLNNNANMPVDMLFGLKYGVSNYDSDILDMLNKDFHKKYYTLQVGIYKHFETNGEFRLVPTLTLDFTNEKNIHKETIVIEGDIATEETISNTENYTNIHFGFPIVFNQGKVLKQSEFIFEPTLSEIFGETHLGFRISFLFNN